MTTPADGSVKDLFEELSNGNRRALAQALSIIESTAPSDTDRRMELLTLASGVKRSATRRIGVTGSPGVGKSTLLETFGMQEIDAGRKVAVLAVDPSSTKTGGSILGDQVRMQHLAQHESAFVRPSPSRLTLGGTAATTRESIVLCEAAGYNTVIVETVGVGQSEIEVADMVDLFMLLVLPTAGDDVQGIKRGIMEVADVVVLTKSDLSNEATSRATMLYKTALSLLLPTHHDWETPVVPVSAPTGIGMDELSTVLDSFFADGRASLLDTQRTDQQASWFDRIIEREIFQRLITNSAIKTKIDVLRSDVVAGKALPSVAATSFLQQLTFDIPTDK